MTTLSSLTTGSTSTSNSGSSSGVTIQEINNLIGYTNTNAVSGLVSGIDTDSIVAKMMESAAGSLIKMQQTQQKLEWQRDDYRSMNTLLQTLQTNVSTMKLQGTYLAKTVNSSNSAVATATAGPTAGNTTYTLSNVTVATSASINGSKINAGSFNPAQSLWSQKDNLVNNNGSSDSPVAWTPVAVSGESQTVSTAGNTFSLKNAYVDSSQTTNISVEDSSGNTANYTAVFGTSTSAPSDLTSNQVYVNTTTGQMTFGSQVASGSTISADYSYDTVDFTLQTYDSSGTASTQEFNFSPSTSLNDILSQVSNSNLGINAFYDTQSGKVSMTRSDTGNLVDSDGSSGEISATGTGADFFNNTLGLGSNATYTAGTNAEFTLNGLQTSRTSNTFTISGMTLTLQGNSTGTTTLNISSDTDSVTSAVNSFISLYNSTISQINSEIDEDPNSSYAPLSSIQQSQMSDTDISNWNAKAQQGMLSNDSVLSSALSAMRTDIYSPVKGTSNSDMSQLAQIGITVSTDYTQHGQLVVSDPTKLQNALSTDPQAVMELFTNQSTDPSSQGIMQRLNTTIQQTMNQIEQKAGNTSSADDTYFLGQNIDRLSDQITAEKTKLSSVETNYYSQFNSMEEAIEAANQQSSYLSSFLSNNS